MLGQPALASAGKYSFHVYLLHKIVILIATAGGWDQYTMAGSGVVAILLISWLLGGLCAPRAWHGLRPIAFHDLF